MKRSLKKAQQPTTRSFIPATKPTEDRAATIDDLSRSGLTDRDAKRLGIEVIGNLKVKQLTGFASTAYRLPYFDVHGKKTAFYRLRFLGKVTPRNANKAQRYWQPSGSDVRAYFPPLGVDWSKVVVDNEKTITITEGEKKSACACKHGIPTIGLGGVWSWRAAKRGVGFIKDLEDIPWKGRKVELVFDSDLASNPQVAAALAALSEALIARGAFVSVVCFPQGKLKIGLDDYLVANGVNAYNDLAREAAQGDLTRALWQLNTEVAYISSLNAVYQTHTSSLLTRATMIGMAYAHHNVLSISPSSGKPVEANVAERWLAWPLRRTYKALVYAPGEDTVTHANELNTWKGLGVEPVKGDITPWGELLDYAFRSDPASKIWFLRWLAYPLQRPGTKLYTAVVLYSRHHGVGKSLIGLTMGRIYGSNFAEISQKELNAPFNSWAVNKQFVLADEITGTNQRRDADAIKNMITRETVTVNKKYEPEYTMRDFTNYLFPTNHPDAFFLDDLDRRHFIHEITDSPLSNTFYQRYDKWMRSDDGPAALLWFLLNRVDVSEFNPRAPAPRTTAKMEMIDLSRSDLDGWASMLKESPENCLRIDGVDLSHRPLFTTAQLLRMYDPHGERKTTLIALSKALSRVGFRRTGVTRLVDGTSHRLWAIREVDKWVRASHIERSTRFSNDNALEPPKEKKF